MHQKNELSISNLTKLLGTKNRTVFDINVPLFLLSRPRCRRKAIRPCAVIQSSLCAAWYATYFLFVIWYWQLEDDLIMCSAVLYAVLAFSRKGVGYIKVLLCPQLAVDLRHASRLLRNVIASSPPIIIGPCDNRFHYQSTSQSISE